MIPGDRSYTIIISSIEISHLTAGEFYISDETYALSGTAERLLRINMVSPSRTISATFSGTIAISASVVILVLLVERSSISGDGANLDILCCRKNGD